ncbi:MAG: SirB2 family protein [Proteobacteria bacterium]|nr:SirB2 family protein [Pseudomonadota bacterium]HQR03464.1 SirB2 family protein [Rhodocyclaceae bacterium]
MLAYLPVKHLHMACAGLSISGFFVRGLLLFRKSSLLRIRGLRAVVDSVDTLLLASAIYLVVSSHQYPFVTGWVTAKLAGLFGYIGLGLLTFRFARTRTAQVSAWLAALLMAANLVATAFLKSPWGLLALWSI